MREIWDRVGISASLLCVLHCLLTPLLVLSMPVVGEFFSHQMFHIIIMVIVVPVAVWALWNGYRLHKYVRVLWLGGAGLAILIASMYLGSHNPMIELTGMVAAGLILASAHLFNLRACKTRH